MKKGGILFAFSVAGLLSSCTGFLPAGGPPAAAMRRGEAEARAHGIQVVELDKSSDPELFLSHNATGFPGEFRGQARPRLTVGRGDVLQVSIVEAPPASLFNGGGIDLSKGFSVAGATALPAQMVNNAGTINTAFAGSVQAAGRTLQEIGGEIAERIGKKSSHPQVLVTLAANNTAYVTVVDEGAAPTVSPSTSRSAFHAKLGVLSAFIKSVRVPLTPRGERLLDAVASAGGNLEDVDKVMVEFTRDGRFTTLPMETVIRNPRENIVLHPGDIITLLHKPCSFTALGATGRNEELAYEGRGINLAQALARSEGLSDARANIRGVFVFRLQPSYSGGRSRVIYCLDLTKPESFLLAEKFWINDGDILYAADAPALELQKFVGILAAITSPAADVNESITLRRRLFR